MSPTFETRIAARVEQARNSPAYANYQRVRRAVNVMMDDWERLDPDGGPSDYWQEEIEGFLYLFDAPPLIVNALRHQCYHITGIRDYEYRAHHRHRAGDFVDKFKMLAGIDRSALWQPEPPDLGGFGFPVGEGLGIANIDTLKFYEVLIGMDRAGIMKKFRGDQPDRRIVVEIGSGWGGFAYQFKKTCPNSTYVCVDLPPTMIFSGTYISTLFPEAKILFYGEEGFEAKLANLKEYDFVFLPHYFFPMWKPKVVDLAINMVSFQEMTTQQVDGYVRRLRELGCPRLYSLNRDRSAHNTELSTVTEILQAHYKVTQLKLLDVQYLHLKPPRKPVPPSVLDYRHNYASL